MLAVLVASVAALPVSLNEASFDDLKFLDGEIKNAQVVQLGEATHGGAEFYTLKTRLVRYLHEKKGFNVLALEAGMIETGLAGPKRNDFTAQQFMEATAFHSFRYREMLPLFEYLKSRPKLKLIGVDPQFSSDEVLALVRDVVKPYDAALAEECAQKLGGGYGYMGLASQPEEFRTQRDVYVKWLIDTRAKLEAIKPKPADRMRFQFLVAGFSGLLSYWSYEPTDSMMDRLAVRDKAMAENLQRQITTDKTIFWAHNGHIGAGLGYKITGDFLRERYADRTYALGLFAQKGEYFQHWTRTVEPWKAAPDGLESKVPTTGEAWFLSLKPFKEPSRAFEPENGGQLPFVPTERFDGAIILTKLSRPTRL